MLILALDTTGERGGAGVFRDEEPLAMIRNEGPANEFSVSLFEMVNRALAQAGVALADIELYAVANGPGSFTGIRVGLAAAQGWATAFGKPARGVSVLEAMVEQAHPKADWAVPILDARRGEYYFAEFRRAASATDRGAFALGGCGMVQGAEALAVTVRELIQNKAANGNVACIAAGADLKAQALRQMLESGTEWLTVEGPLLQSIARLALGALRSGQTARPSDLDACYIRRPDAELNMKKAEN
jgi:tRNA threonylcarbamoyladenosine biosynthesis protein TsaB